MYTITTNSKFNSREIKFENKPDANVLTALKDLKMRWNPKRGIWYGFATETEIENAILKNEKKEHYIIENDGYLGGGGYIGNNYKTWHSDQELKKLLINDFKKIEIKTTIRCKNLIHITVCADDTWIVSKDEYIKNFTFEGINWLYDSDGDMFHINKYYELPSDKRENIKNATAKRYYNNRLKYNGEIDINKYHIDTDELLTEKAKNKLQEMIKIITSYNYDESNSMVDYFSTGFYYDIALKIK